MEIWLFCKTLLLFLTVSCKFSLANDGNTFKQNYNFSKELNAFLTNVLQHRDDFKFVRNAARYYHKRSQPKQETKFHYLPNEQDILNEEISSMLRNRYKRHLLNSRRNKIKTPINIENNVHKTLVKSKIKTAATIEATPDYAVINLADLEQKAIDPKINNNNNNKRQISNEYNDPNGNDLYSVNFGQNDFNDDYDDDQSLQYNQKFLDTNHQHPEHHRAYHHKFKTEHNNHQVNNLNKLIDDFVTNADIEDFYNFNQGSKREDENIKFHSRQLKFLSDTMMNFDDNYDINDEDYNWERTRRDFLDKLQMNDEDNYSEDNPYLDQLKDNNTSINNDTRIQAKKICKSHNRPNLFDKIKDVFNKKAEPSNSSRTNKRESNDLNVNDNKFQQSISNLEQNQPFNVLDKLKKLFHKGNTTNSTKANKREKLKFEDFNDIIENDEDDDDNWNDNNARISRNSPQLSNQDILDHLVDQLQYPKGDQDDDDNVLLDDHRQILNEMKNMSGGQHNDMPDENLAKLINGQLSSKIVTLVFKELPPMNQLKKGLSRRHFNYFEPVDTFDIIKNSTSPVETQELLKRLAQSLTVFITKEIHHGSCLRLTDDLYEFLKDLVEIHDESRSSTVHTPNLHQDSRFLFESNAENHHNLDAFGKRKLEDTLITLESLLDNYHKLSSDSQNQAKPVKEYIEKHIVTLRSLITNGVIDNNVLANNGGGKLKFNMKRETKGKSYKSEKYKKLQRAVQQIREKRANEKKIGELFGKEMKRGPKFDINYEQPVVFNIA